MTVVIMLQEAVGRTAQEKRIQVNREKACHRKTAERGKEKISTGSTPSYAS